MSYNLIFDKIKKTDLLDFSRRFPINRPNYLGDRLFPNIKTENLEAEYERLASGANLPYLAQVHAFDTEAQIGTRPAMQSETIQKLFVKEKINQSERVRQYLSKGATNDAIVRYIFDDAARLAESVKAKTEAMKMELFCNGQITVHENGLNLTLGYGVGNDHKVSSDWSEAGASILNDIRVWKKICKDKGWTVNRAVTTEKVMNWMCANTEIQKLINGNANAGIFVSADQVQQLIIRMLGITVEVEDEGLYKYVQADGTVATKRFFDEHKFIMYMGANDGSIGNGIWGTTPEELDYGAFTSKNLTQFITITQWETPDPVARWTKASGLMVPVLPNPEGIIIADVYDRNPRLASLTLGSLTLSPSFDKDTVTYTTTTSNASNTVTATAVDTDATIVIKNGTTTVTNGGTASWSTGANTLTVTVTNGDDSKVYTVTVTKSE